MPTQANMETYIRLELADAGTVWSDGEIDRAIAKSESLLSRAIPKKAIYEARLLRTVTDAAFTVASSTGTTAYKPIKWKSEVLVNGAGTTMVRNTNYTINYMTGVITEIGALLPDASTYTISYELDPQKFDLGSLLTNPLKVTRVEYPVGNNPPTYLGSFDLIEDFLLFNKEVGLTHNEHIRIYYDSMWTGAADGTTGEYPENLGDVVIIGAVGQCLLMKAEKYVQSAIAEVMLANAAADSMATPLADINTALDKITTYLTTGTTAAGTLTLITSQAADLRAAIETALDGVATFLTATGSSSAPSAKYALVTGMPYTLTVNVSDNVASKYSDYARACIQLVSSLIAEASARIENIRTYVAEADEWVKVADGYLAEATQRIAEAQAWAAQADRYIATNREYLNIAGRYLASGQAKINEFYTLLGGKPEIQQVRTNAAQNPNY